MDLIVPGPGVEQRRPVHRLFREIGVFWVDLHPGGLAVRPDVSDRPAQSMLSSVPARTTLMPGVAGSFQSQP